MKYCLIITLIRRLNIVVTLIIILSLVIQKCCRILLLIVFFIKYKELSNVSNMNLQREMAQKIEDVIKSEEKNKIEDYLYDLKVSLKMQMTKGSYSKKDIRKLKKIYDYIAEL